MTHEESIQGLDQSLMKSIDINTAILNNIAIIMNVYLEMSKRHKKVIGVAKKMRTVIKHNKMHELKALAREWREAEAKLNRLKIID